MPISLICRVIAVLMAFAGPVWAQAPRVLRVVPSADLSELDPTRGPNLVTRIYAGMVFDTLFALDRSMTPRPMMVDTWTVSDDRLNYRFTLRQGLHFHDGSPVTARDAVASVERWMAGGSIGAQLRARVAGMQAVDALTFTMLLKQPFGLLEYALAGPGGAVAGIMRESDARRAAGVPLTQPIGSGPFRYVAAERQVGHRVVFERNPDYPARAEPPDGLAGGRVVKVDRVEWLIIPDPATAANALIAGEVDMLETAGTDLVPFLKQRGMQVRRTTPLPTLGFIRPNHQMPPFNDVRARQALALLADQAEAMQAVAGDAVPWSRCFSFSICGSSLGTEAGSEPYRTPDIARAKRLLAEAGYRGETIVVLTAPAVPAMNAIAEVIAQRLRDAGMTVDLQADDWAVLLRRVNTRGITGRGAWHLFAGTAAGSNWFHPLTNIGLDLSCSDTGFAGFPCDAEGETLRQAVLAAPDDAVRVEAFETLQRRLWAVIPYVPAGLYDVTSAMRPGVTGVLDGWALPYWNIEKR